MAALRSPARDLAPGLPAGVLAALRADFTSSAAADALIDATIGRYASAATSPYALCPHTATAIDGAEAFLLLSPAAAATSPPLPTLVLATAHPAKFAQGTPALASRGLYAEVYGRGGRGAEAVGSVERPPLPPQLRGLSSRPRRCIAVDLPLPSPQAAEGAAYVRGLAEVQAVVDAVLGGPE